MAENKNAQKVREITDKLEQGIKELFESEKFKEYLTTMSKFYNYSFNNTLLIAMQKPDATLIAGYTAWQRNFDRHVLKGEKGIKILAPAPYKTREEREKLDPATQKPMLDADGKPVTETVEVLRPAFKVVSVFDVSQTDGKELPDIAVDELTGSVENYAAFWEALRQESPAPISFEDISGGAKGYFSPAENRIAIQEGMSEIQTVKTAIHEIAHAKLHAINPAEKTAPENRKDRHTKEVEAESVAYTVCQRYGIETSDYSFGYIAGWSSDKDTKELKDSLETIRNAASELIEGIDAKLKVLLAEKEQEQVNTHEWDTAVVLSSEGKGYIEAHVTDEGIDYSIYDPDMKLADGGIIEDTGTTAYSAAMSLCAENGYENPDIVSDHEAFQEQVAAANEPNSACAKAIEQAISENYSDYKLSSRAAVMTVLAQFSEERVQYVLANTVQHNRHDGRYHAENKAWAGKISVCEENSEAFIISQAHPGLVNLFINQFRELQREKAQEQHESVPVPEPKKASASKHRLTPDEKEIKEAVMDILKAQIAYANDGMRSTVKTSEHSHRIMAQNKVIIEGNTVTRNGEPLFAIHRRHSAKKTQGCYRELMPVLEYIEREKSPVVKQEKPSIREQLKAAAKAQPERKAPAKQKSHERGLE